MMAPFHQRLCPRERRVVLLSVLMWTFSDYNPSIEPADNPGI
jgi:hypothetical protein